MSIPADVLDYQAIQDTQMHESPFPYCIIDDVFTKELKQSIVNTFPSTKFGGSVPPESLLIQPAFQKLIDALEGDALKKTIAEKFQINLENRPTMITVRSVSRSKDGRIHTDTNTKLMTVLLYLNEHWPAQSGKLRLLHNGNSLENYFEE